MKFITFLLLLFIVSCEQPRTGTRVNTNSTTSQNGTIVIYQGLNDEDKSTDEQNNSSTGDNNTDNNNSIFTGDSLIGKSSDNENCNWSEDAISNFQYQNDLLGEFNLCRSSTNTNLLYFQIKSPPTSDVCFFPMYQEQSGAMHYLGNASCISAKTSNQIFSIELYKNRVNFSHHSISGTMIMLNASYTFPYPYQVPIEAPAAFKLCMDYAYETSYYYGYADESYCQAFISKNIHSYFSF